MNTENEEEGVISRDSGKARRPRLAGRVPRYLEVAFRVADVGIANTPDGAGAEG